MHFDVRLEVDGVLASWAVWTRSPPPRKVEVVRPIRQLLDDDALRYAGKVGNGYEG